MEVIWKDIPGYEGLYKISTKGDIYACSRVVKSPRQKNYIYKGHPMSLYHNKTNGYVYVELSKDGEKKKYRVHRLVALAFIENPLGLPQINHINEDRADNRVDNLEWCDEKYNCNYGTRNEKLSKILTESVGRPVIQFSKDGRYIARYKNILDAAKKTGTHRSDISCCALKRKLKAHNGKLYIRHSAGGYVWKFEEQNE